MFPARVTNSILRQLDSLTIISQRILDGRRSDRSLDKLFARALTRTCAWNLLCELYNYLAICIFCSETSAATDICIWHSRVKRVRHGSQSILNICRTAALIGLAARARAFWIIRSIEVLFLSLYAESGIFRDINF